LISLISTKIIYDHMYDKSFGLTNAKWVFIRDRKGDLFFLVLYLVMISLILIYYFFGDIIIYNINLHNLGLVLDLITYILRETNDFIILILKYIWIGLKIIMKFIIILFSIFS
jgi:hypothetical protein